MSELERLYNILVEILGESKSGYSEGQTQYEFPCPHCIEKYGNGEIQKANLSISLSKQWMNCWKCSSEGDDEMHGSIKKLIRLFGNQSLLEEYFKILGSIKESKLYKIDFNEIDTSVIDREKVKFPSSFKLFKPNEKNNYGAVKYLKNRGIGWDIIERYGIGYTEKETENKKGSFRIIIPSYDSVGELNYWVGRDYLPKSAKFSSRLKYDNPKVQKRDIIFNEGKIQWDADVTLVEGPFDHIVVPNSVPLLGKALNKNYKLYWELVSRANANINIMIDGDAFETAKEIYALLNHGRLYNRIRYIPIGIEDDPSTLYQKGGYKEIASALANAVRIKEAYLIQ